MCINGTFFEITFLRESHMGERGTGMREGLTLTRHSRETKMQTSLNFLI